jgi:VWFA-related protein
MKHFSFLFPLLLLFSLSLNGQYIVDVQVVDLQISVLDRKGSFIADLKPDDFLIREDGVNQTVLDLNLAREPFSIGILLDTSSSMSSSFKITTRGTEDFLSSLGDQDEFFLMTFDDRLRMAKPQGLALERTSVNLKDLHFGQGTRLYDAVDAGVDKLRTARYPRRALFVISDGVNTRGGGSLGKAIATAQKNKVIVYSLVIDRSDSDFNALRTLSEQTGGTYFILYKDFPRLQAAYTKISSDLAHRFTLYYRSTSDYGKGKKPKIQVQMKNREWQVRYQKTYYPD